jgi:hypothetical protein
MAQWHQRQSPPSKPRPRGRAFKRKDISAAIREKDGSAATGAGSAKASYAVLERHA